MLCSALLKLTGYILDSIITEFTFNSKNNKIGVRG